MVSSLRSLAVRAVPAGRHAGLRDDRAAAFLAAAGAALPVHHAAGARLNLWGARWICGIRQPRDRHARTCIATPHIVMCKHSSTWETLSLSRYLPPLAYVAKKELLSIPFFGWAFRLASPITIDRKAGQDAMAQIADAGPRALRAGLLDRRLPGRHAHPRAASARATRPAARGSPSTWTCRSCRSRTTPAGCGPRA